MGSWAIRHGRRPGAGGSRGRRETDDDDDDDDDDEEELYYTTSDEGSAAGTSTNAPRQCSVAVPSVVMAEMAAVEA
ncbi:hypothetical protein GGH13_008703 [Coemansia sp. S155-1]|nr:hypothetical protein GGH13_008703 [Coemansia sp. S155-1]